MSRIIGVVLGFLIGFSALGQEKPKETEKIDGKLDRSLTGFIEKIDAKDATTGSFVMRTDKDQPRYTFQVDAKTKFLTNKGEPLDAGLQNPKLANAEVRVLFVDLKPKDVKSPDLHLCHTLQIINPGK